MSPSAQVPPSAHVAAACAGAIVATEIPTNKVASKENDNMNLVNFLSMEQVNLSSRARENLNELSLVFEQNCRATYPLITKCKSEPFSFALRLQLPLLA